MQILIYTNLIMTLAKTYLQGNYIVKDGFGLFWMQREQSRDCPTCDHLRKKGNIGIGSS